MEVAMRKISLVLTTSILLVLIAVSHAIPSSPPRSPRRLGSYGRGRGGGAELDNAG